MIYEVSLKKINQSNFADYGEYLDESEMTPTASEECFDWWNAVGFIDIEGRTSLGVVKPKYNSRFTEEVFEQHNKTPEVLIPMDEDVILLLAKEDAFKNEIPSNDDFEAFLVPRGTVVTLKPGVWHHAPMVLEKESRVLVLFKENTSFEDIIVKDLGKVGITVMVKI